MNIDCSKAIKGAAIGLAFLYDVKKYTNSEDFLADKEKHFSVRFSKPKYGFLLKAAKKLNKSVTMIGRLGFFDVYQEIY